MRRVIAKEKESYSKMWRGFIRRCDEKGFCDISGRISLQSFVQRDQNRSQERHGSQESRSKGLL